MAKYIVAFLLIAGSAMAEYWLIQLPITDVGTNSTVAVTNSFPNKGVLKGWYIDVSGNESASFTGTVSAVHSSKGVRTLGTAVATVAAPAITNALDLNLFDEQIRLSIISPATATNTVTLNAVMIYDM